MKVVIFIVVLAGIIAIGFVALKKDDGSSNDTVVTKVKTENENGSNEPKGGENRSNCVQNENDKDVIGTKTNRYKRSGQK